MRTLDKILCPAGDINSIPILDSFADMLAKMLIYDPDRRITAQEALKHPFFALASPSVDEEFEGALG
jgi:serine/threonine protein kinase